MTNKTRPNVATRQASLKARQSADVSIPVPADLVRRMKKPAHFSAEAHAQALQAGWSIYYMIDSDGNCWWDGEQFSTTPKDFGVPITLVRSHAPEWFNWCVAEMGVVTASGHWYPRYSDGSSSRLLVDYDN